MVESNRNGQSLPGNPLDNLFERLSGLAPLDIACGYDADRDCVVIKSTGGEWEVFLSPLAALTLAHRLQNALHEVLARRWLDQR